MRNATPLRWCFAWYRSQSAGAINLTEIYDDGRPHTHLSQLGVGLAGSGEHSRYDSANCTVDWVKSTTSRRYAQIYFL